MSCPRHVRRSLLKAIRVRDIETQTEYGRSWPDFVAAYEYRTILPRTSNLPETAMI
jgi:hypothetical protein